jgi:NADP-dependent 3-hydroxy acid dehydrogenase YdfG
MAVPGMSAYCASKFAVYQASRISVDGLDAAKQTCQAVWLRMVDTR